MAISTFSDVKITSFETLAMIGGSYRELTFVIKNANGTQIGFSGNDSFVWTLAPYTQDDYIALTKNGVLVDGNFVIYLLSSDTENLSGKYIQLGVVNTGLPNYVYPVGRGIVDIIPRGGIVYG
jgi:hypothetical protein